MPELPEVETITRELSRALVGKKLEKFSIFDTEKISQPLLGLPKKITGVRRRGKYVVCETSGGARCLIHLRMTGELLFVDKKSTNKNRREIGALSANGLSSDDALLADGALSADGGRAKHERARFHFNGGSILRFVDARRFGTIEWQKNHHPLPALGPDPLSKNFTSRAFATAIRKSSRTIKSFLLDQRKIAGIGNIYADEALWTAKIHPKRRAGGLSALETAQLAASIKKVLREAIKKGGFTLRDYRRVDGRFGEYQKFRKVYNREGLPCLRCSAKIKRTKLGGRSSYFCPKCQKIENRK